MRICRFRPTRWPTSMVRSGVVIDGPGDGGSADVILDLAAAFTQLLVDHEGADVDAAAALAQSVFPASTVAMLGTWGRASALAAEVIDAESNGLIARDADSALGPLSHRRSDVALLAPVDRPPALRDFFAFETHMKNALRNLGQEVPEAWYEAPSHYVTRSASVIGPDEEARWPHYTDKLDFELELAVVIGRRCRDLDPDDARDHIVGLTIFNDLSCRDVQRREMGTRVGPAKTKGYDGASPMGPYLVTLDELSWPFSAGMRAYVNGELWSEGNADSIYWSLDQLVAAASAAETLYPGDVLGSGTVGTGAGIEIDRWIAPDDLIRLEIDGLGGLDVRPRRYPPQPLRWSP